MRTRAVRELRELTSDGMYVVSALVRAVVNYVRTLNLVDWEIQSNLCDLHVVSATDESHFESALQLVASLRQHCPDASLVMFDLGLKENSRLRLIRGGVHVQTFPFDEYPEFFDMSVNHGSYAWKPIIIAEELLNCSKSRMVWLDAGCKVTSRFPGIAKLITRFKIVANPSSSTYEKWLHPTAAKAFVESSILSREQIIALSKKNMISAAFLGFDTQSTEARRLVEKWAAFAQTRDFIGPIGSSTANHRFDQVLLDALIRKSGVPHFPYENSWLPSSLVGIWTHQDVERQPHVN